MTETSIGSQSRGWIGLVLLSFATRLCLAGWIEAMPEEAYYWNYAQRPSLGYFDHPPAVAWMIWCTTRLAGHNDFALRLGPLLCVAIASFFVYRLARRRWQDSNAGWRAVALLNLLPIFSGMGFLAFPDAPLMAAWSAAIYFGYRAVETGRIRFWLLWGAAAGWALLSKYTGGALLLAAGAFLLLTPEGRAQLKKPGIYLGLLTAWVVFSPVVWWNWQHQWMSFRFQFAGRHSHGIHFSLPLLLVLESAAVTPVAFVAFVVLAAVAVRRREWQDRWLAWQFWPIFLGFAAYSFKGETHINWITPGYLSVLVLAQGCLVRGPGHAPWSLRCRCAAFRWSVALGVVAGYWLGFFLAGFLPRTSVPPPLAHRLAPQFFWKDIAEDVDHLQNKLLSASGVKTFSLAVDKYYLASEIAYYDPEKDGARSTSRNLLGEKALAWNLWTVPEDLDGRNAVIVAFDPKNLSDEQLQPFFKSLGPIQAVEANEGVPARHGLHYRFGYGYQHQHRAEQPASPPLRKDTP
ncbi:MAG: glycosyltransferase family 39 protein [Verrucomicrobia bacterium]|nr:glycosyltransferase family 39 protein [Verrucomicrobiota bacterium]